MKYLAKNLRVDIILRENRNGPGQEIEVRLTNPLLMESIEEVQPVNQTTPYSQQYHLLEAIVLSLRRVVSAGAKAGLIAVKAPTASRGVCPNLKITTRPSSDSGTASTTDSAFP